MNADPLKMAGPINLQRRPSAMLNIAKPSRAASLIALLAISYMVIGVPLIHPMSHDHAAHGGHLSGQLGGPCLSAVESDGDIDCPVCKLLSTTHCMFNPWRSYAVIDSPPFNLDLCNHAAPAKACQNQEKSRAPPFYDRIT